MTRVNKAGIPRVPLVVKPVQFGMRLPSLEARTGSIVGRGGLTGTPPRPGNARTRRPSPIRMGGINHADRADENSSPENGGKSEAIATLTRAMEVEKKKLDDATRLSQNLKRKDLLGLAEERRKYHSNRVQGMQQVLEKLRNASSEEAEQIINENSPYFEVPDV